MEPPVVKPGWQTTEFWVTLAGTVVTALVLSGWMPSADQAAAQGGAQQTITAAVTVIANLVLAYKYIHARTQLKGAALNSRP